jgi:D-arabinose 1-dehydrogenase-like Zn-dependent alcohol dehydrogenase
VVFREVELYGCHWASVVDMIEVLDLVAQGSLKPVITRTYPFERRPQPWMTLKAVASSAELRS